MNHRLIPVLIISIIWAVIVNLCKYVINNQKNILPFVIAKGVFMGIIGLVITVLYYKDNDIEKVFNFDNKTYKILILLAILELMASFYYFGTLKNNEASWSVAMIEAGVILFSSLLSIYMFKEYLTPLRIFGILFIIVGIYMVNLT